MFNFVGHNVKFTLFQLTWEAIGVTSSIIYILRSSLVDLTLFYQGVNLFWFPVKV